MKTWKPNSHRSMYSSLTCRWNSRCSRATLRACFPGCQESRLFVFWQSSPREVLFLSAVHNVSQAHMFQADGWKKMKKKVSSLLFRKYSRYHTHHISHSFEHNLITWPWYGKGEQLENLFLCVWHSAKLKARSSVIKEGLRGNWRQLS